MEMTRTSAPGNSGNFRLSGAAGHGGGIPERDPGFILSETLISLAVCVLLLAVPGYFFLTALNYAGRAESQAERIVTGREIPHILIYGFGGNLSGDD
jgi:hypothetical protein